MSVGFPDGTPLRKAATFTYNHVTAVQFLRTTYKAGPLLALGLACLGGVAFAELWARRWHGSRRAVVAARTGRTRRACRSSRGRRWSSPGSAFRPRGRTWRTTSTARCPRGSRAVVLPGQPFAFYRWGGTVDPILPSLTSRPVAIRNVPPYDDLHAVDMLWTTDNLVQPAAAAARRAAAAARPAERAFRGHGDATTT